MSVFIALLLGVVQGLTEFLPVSSSGHLVLAKHVLGIAIEDIAFEVFVHFGTLLSVLTVFNKEIVTVLKGCRAILFFRVKHASEEEQLGIKMLWWLIIGTLPAAVVGFLFKDTFEAAFAHPEFACAALIATGMLLTASRFARDTKELTAWRALGIGVAQIGAILPGISRSGTTISTGMLLGVQREQAARFSFLLAIPLILGATVLQVRDLAQDLPAANELAGIAAGTIAAYVSGLFAIRWLLAAVRNDRFSLFAYYCFAVGGIGLVTFYFI